MTAKREAADVVALANQRASAREQNRVLTDYDALNRLVRRQRSALTRAVNSGDKNRVVIACRDAVREWNKPGLMWPDDWNHWQNALDDALGFRNEIDLRDLA